MMYRFFLTPDRGPLHTAIMTFDPQKTDRRELQALLANMVENGEDVNSTNSNGNRTPLFYAASYAKTCGDETIRYLIEVLQANPNIPDNVPEFPLQRYLTSTQISLNQTPENMMHAITLFKQQDKLQKLLEENPDAVFKHIYLVKPWKGYEIPSRDLRGFISQVIADNKRVTNVEDYILQNKDFFTGIFEEKNATDIANDEELKNMLPMLSKLHKSLPPPFDPVSGKYHGISEDLREDKNLIDFFENNKEQLNVIMARSAWSKPSVQEEIGILQTQSNPEIEKLAQFFLENKEFFVGLFDEANAKEVSENAALKPLLPHLEAMKKTFTYGFDQPTGTFEGLNEGSTLKLEHHLSQDQSLVKLLSENKDNLASIISNSSWVGLRPPSFRP